MIERNNFRWLIGGAVVIILFLISLWLYVAQSNFFQEKTVSFLSSLQGIENYISPFREWFDDLFHFNQLRRTARQAEEENLRLLVEKVRNKELEQENNLLRQALQMKKEKPWHLVLAKVIFTDPTNLKGTFWVDKGKADGLAKGMNVVIGEKILVGRLEKCFSSFCEGISILRPGSRLSVKDNRSGALAIAEIEGKGGFYLKLVSSKADVKAGDIVVTSKENLGFLPGLLVARVGKEQSSPASFLKEFSLEPLLEKTNISSVLIISNEIPL